MPFRLFMLILLSFFALPADSDAASVSPHCYQECPDAPMGDVSVVRHHAFTLAPDPATKIAAWIAYKITPATLGPTRPRRWRADPDLADAITLEPADYRGAARAGYDRGHLAPLASLSGDDWAETNFTSNLAPQRRRFNRGPWAQVEAYERALITDRGYDTVYVVVQPLYQHGMPPLPQADEPHRVPSGFVKTIVALKSAQVLHVVFYTDQSRGILRKTEEVALISAKTP